MLLTSDMLLCDVIEENPSLVPVLGRFGIRLGVGEKSIKEVAHAHDTSPDFLLLVLNTYLNDSYFPEKKLRKFDVAQIVGYMHATNNYYLSSQLPNIEKHLHAFISASPAENNSLDILGSLFDDFKQGLINRIEQDEQVDFPAFIAGRQLPLPYEGNGPEELLAEMCSIIVRYLSGSYNQNLCFGVLFSLSTMRRDIAQHNRIRRSLMHRTSRSESHNSLTGREIEVLKKIVEGKINREIADELCISYQTVLSHRKNIIVKLGIKSVSGLTFYALSHGISK